MPEDRLCPSTGVESAIADAFDKGNREAGMKLLAACEQSRLEQNQDYVKFKSFSSPDMNDDKYWNSYTKAKSVMDTVRTDLWKGVKQAQKTGGLCELELVERHDNKSVVEGAKVFCPDGKNLWHRGP